MNNHADTSTHQAAIHISSIVQRISLICTVRDEADNIAALLDSMIAQRRAPDEIVINDCGSVDETAAIVRHYAACDERIRLVQGGWNISSGRNNAVRAAAGPIIACTDAGLTLDPNWLGRIVAPIESNQADFVGGFFHPAPQSIWELALGATNYRSPKEINPNAFLPFGQSLAFRKDAWAAVGGFSEWVSHCEDIVFDLALRKAGYRAAFVPDALVAFRPRSSLRAFVRQYFLYARGDGRAGLWARRHALRYTTYAGALALLFASTRSTVIKKYGLTGAIILGAAAYTRAPYQRLWPRMRALTLLERAYALALVPLIRVIGDLAKMAGYPIGVVQRLAQADMRHEAETKSSR